jgi:two-component system NtrC family sensor kinase
MIKEEYRGLTGGKVFAYTPLNNGNWVLCFQQELDDAYAALSKTRTLAILLVILSVVIVILAALLLARRMTRRVAEVLLEKDKMGDQVIEAGRLASIGELAAGIAHEVNNPVAIMVEEAGWIQDLLDEDDPSGPESMAEIERAAKQIRIQGRRCKDITQKLLSFARKTDPRTKKIRINQLIEEVVSLIDQKARYANVRVRVDLATGLPLLVAPASELQQVLLNLFNNAVDAIGKSGGTIEVRSRLVPGGIAVEIEDDGIGIAEANLPRIFDPFYTTKPVGQGTGLGLSICYGIVKKLGGEISAQSAKEKGTRFTMTLPVNKPQGTEPDRQKAAADAANPAAEYLKLKEVES